MLKNLLTLLISSLFALTLFFWLAPYILSGRLDSLPDYRDLVDYAPSRPGGHMLPDKNLTVSSDRYGHEVRWITNSQGYRNDHEITSLPAAGSVRILFYGDSFVSGIRTDQGNTIGAVLERELERRLQQPVEVVISGHNNLANAWYHWQTYGRHIHPNFVILGLTVGNDITAHNFGAGIEPTLVSMDELISLSPGSTRAGVQNIEAMIPPDGFLSPNERSSMAVLSSRAIRLLGHLAYPYANDVAPALWPDQGENGQARAAGFFVSLGLYYRGSIAAIESLWNDFDTMLPGFVAQVRHHGATPLLVSFPTRIEALPRDWLRLADALQLNPEQFDLSKPWRHISDLCAHIALPCLDTSSTLQSAQQQGEVFMSLGDMHFSAHGQQAVAKMLADYFATLTLDAPVPPLASGWLETYGIQVHAWDKTKHVLEEAGK